MNADERWHRWVNRLAFGLDKILTMSTERNFGIKTCRIQIEEFLNNEFFETEERREFVGFIAIRVGELLITGSEMSIERITQRMKGKSEVDIYDENEATYIGMKITKVKGEDFEEVVLDSNKSDAKNKSHRNPTRANVNP